MFRLGNCPGIRPTSHKHPVYEQYGVIHYAVPNMPALVGRTSTLGLTQATEPYVAMLVRKPSAIAPIIMSVFALFVVLVAIIALAAVSVAVTILYAL